MLPSYSQLAISPQASSSGEPVTVRSDTNLTLKVEGVIQRGERPSLFRCVHAVSVTVTTSLVSRAPTQQAAANSKVRQGLRELVISYILPVKVSMCRKWYPQSVRCIGLLFCLTSSQKNYLKKNTSKREVCVCVLDGEENRVFANRVLVA